MVIRFSSGANFDEFNGCDSVFEDTSKLGNYAICRWVGSTTLYIILGFGSDLLAVGKPGNAAFVGFLFLSAFYTAR